MFRFVRLAFIVVPALYKLYRMYKRAKRPT
jgi:hypothetical protein